MERWPGPAALAPCEHRKNLFLLLSCSLRPFPQPRPRHKVISLFSASQLERVIFTSSLGWVRAARLTHSRPAPLREGSSRDPAC